MKYLLSLVFYFVLSALFSQEIIHNHSIHHAFIENKGQWDEQILFQSKFKGGNMWIQQNKFVFHLQDYSRTHDLHAMQKPETNKVDKQHVVHFNFKNSQKVSTISKFGKTAAYYNYFLGNDREKWASDVRGYSEAILHDLYEGIDLKLIENELSLKYEFHVQAHKNPSVIQIEIAGAAKLSIDKNGQLHVQTPAGNIIEEKPYVYQISNGKIIQIPCNFSLKNSTLSFELGKYDSSVPLIIDPTLIFATFSGAVTDNFGMTATYAHDGSAYSGGTIYGNNYPTPDLNAFDITSNFTVTSNPATGITDVFISKYSADGSTMIWTSFLGGGNGTGGTETVHSLIADAQDNLYLYGATSSQDFPMVNAYQGTFAGGTPGVNYVFNGVYYTTFGTDIFVSKFSANGHNLLASTYIGGTANDGVNYKVTSGTYGSAAAYDSLTNNYGDQFRGEVMLDQDGNCVVATCTRSTDFPMVNPIQSTLAGQQDGVVFKLSPDLSTLLWSTYYGGTGNDACYSVKIDSSQNIVVGGGTTSSNLPATAGGYQATYQGGKTDGFIVKYNAANTAILQATYVGTPNLDQIFFIEIDRNDKIFALGQSVGGQFPVINATYSNANSSQFIAKFNENLTAIENSTVIGAGTSNINISPAAFMVDICGNVYLSGWGASILQNVPLSGMPVTPNAFQSTPANGFDFYLFVLQRDFADVLYGSYLGGPQAQEHVDGGTSRFDKNGIVYQSACGGCGGYSDFPTTAGSHSTTNNSTRCNNLVFKFDFNLIPNADFSIDNNSGCIPFTVTFDNFSSSSDSYLWDFGNNDTTSTIFNPTITYTTPGTYQVNLYVTDSICLLTDTASLTITVLDSIHLTTSPDIQLCIPTQSSFTAFSNGAATNFEWSTDPSFTTILNNNQADSTLTVTPQGPQTYYVRASNAACSSIDSVVVYFIGASINLVGDDTLCLGESATVSVINSNPLVQFTYQWSPNSIINSGNGTNQVVVQPDTSQYIYVLATAGNGCTAQDSLLINVGNIPDSLVSLTANPNVIPEGASTTLTATPAGYNYWWQPQIVQNQNSHTVNVNELQETTLFAVYISDGICVKSDTATVIVMETVCDAPFVYVPNAFTPNNDGENDILYVYGQVFFYMEFRIYDRWGELVFESNDRSKGWDGTFRGKPLDPDVYDYYLKVDCYDKTSNLIKGNITLMK